jgi:hypothetical protein
MKKKLIKSCIWSIAVCGSETWFLGKNEVRVVNAFETWSWRRMLKIKWTYRMTNDKSFKGRKKEDYFKNLKKYTPLMGRAYN